MSEATPAPLSARRLLPLALIVLAAVLFLVLGGWRYLSFETLAAHRDWLCSTMRKGGFPATIAFVLGYAALVTVSVPGAAIFTITSGFLFGAWLGGVYALIGATLGASAAFLAVRAGLSGLVARAGPRLRRLEAGFRRNALSYLLVVRLVPIFPFWLVNLAAGLTGMRLGTYVVGTFFGMIPATFIFASLGSGVGDVLAQGQHPDLHVMFRPTILLPIAGLALLALVPVGYRALRPHRRDRAAHP